VFRFVQEKEGLGFAEAVEALADRYGVETEREREDPRAEEARKRRARLGEALERTAQFYTHYLWESGEAAKAREYLTSRSLGEEVLRAFGVGFAPSAWDQVLTRGQRAGFSVAELSAAGLIQKGRQGGHYDRFRARIMFPVRDGRGRVQGFGARAAIAKAGRAVVVEGYMDALAAHQAQIEEAVAVMGTAITPEQLQQLSGHAEEAVLALDADRAGRAAMLRAQRVAGSRRLRLRVAAMPAGEDPADMLEAGQGGRIREAIDGAVELPEFHVRLALDEADLSSPAGRDRALDEVVPVMAAMRESISRSELARLVADRLDADPGLVMRRVEGGQVGGASPAGREAPRADGDSQALVPDAPRRPLSVRERREQALLAMCIATPGEGQELLGRLTAEHLSSPAVARARDWLAEHLGEPLRGLPREDEELVSLITQLVMRAEREPGGREAMELNFLQLEQGLIEGRIQAAQQGGGDPPVELQRRRAELAERIAHWETASAG
jgi:DNA primase